LRAPFLLRRVLLRRVGHFLLPLFIGGREVVAEQQKFGFVGFRQNLRKSPQLTSNVPLT
jgi:hypothetical protein